MPFRILFVCTGNVCRSSMAELLFRAWADPGADVDVRSAGLGALVGHRIDHGSASALGQLGIDPSAHRARQVEPWMVADADLVLTAERAHRERLMLDVPTAYKRIFTIREFARLAPYVDSADPRTVVAQAAAARSRLGAEAGDEDDIGDPYRGTTSRAASVAQEISDALRVALDVLGFAAPPVRARRPLPYRT